MNRQHILLITIVVAVISIIFAANSKPKIPNAVVLEGGIHCTASIADQIADEDRHCKDTTDCIPVRCDCSSCGSVAANLGAQQKIIDLHDEACEGIPQAPVECPRFKVACVEGVCQMVEHIKITVPRDEETCKDQDGRWGAFDWTGRKFCIIPAPDAGTPCSDTTQCESSCLAPGRCSNWYPQLPKGCYRFVQHGEIQPETCLD